MVTSAGNDRMSMQPIKQELSASEEIITVGNCSIKGDPNDTSSFSAKITLCAPSDNFLTSYDFEGNAQLFGGTSGASPTVTGALAAFTAITGYSLNPREAVKLLRKTAIPHPRFANHLQSRSRNRQCLEDRKSCLPAAISLPKKPRLLCRCALF